MKKNYMKMVAVVASVFTVFGMMAQTAETATYADDNAGAKAIGGSDMANIGGAVPNLSVSLVLTPDNQKPLKDLQDGSISLRFPEFSTLFCDQASVRMERNGGLWSFLPVDMKGNSVSLSLREALTDPGEYRIFFPDGSIMLEVGCASTPTYLPAFEIVYNITGNGTESAIDVIGSDNGEASIYRLDGTKVNGVAAHGIFIINGKKTLVK